MAAATSYRPVATNGDVVDGSSQGRHKFSEWRVHGVPVMAAGVAVMVLLSQHQVALALYYEYSYTVKGVTDGGDSNILSYSLWQGITSLYHGNSVLGTFVFIWSGLFPFVQLLLLGIVDWLGRRRKDLGGVSRRWSWLIALSRWSFANLWLIAALTLSVKIDMKKVQIVYASFFGARLRLNIWLQAFALEGGFFFAAALASSQVLGHFVIQRAVYGKHPITFKDPEPVALLRPGDSNLMKRSSGTCSAGIALGCLVTFVGMLAGAALPFVRIEW